MGNREVQERSDRPFYSEAYTHSELYLISEQVGAPDLGIAYSGRGTLEQNEMTTYFSHKKLHGLISSV